MGIEHADALQYDRDIINDALSCVRAAIAGKIGSYLDARAAEAGAYGRLYRLLRDYPFRQGKMLRPAICIAAARALGAMGHTALTVATALELYHNAFLIHDDIEDGSESRRGGDTLHRQVGIARAINAGDATNVMSVGLLLENLAVVGVAKALHLLHEIELMARQSAEGQAMELDWVNENAAALTDDDYFAMCTKKTCWYSFITPLRAGLIVGWPIGRGGEIGPAIAAITRFGAAIGIAFQVQDDLLNLRGEQQAYGKEIGGDMYEGKRTLMLNHVLRESPRAAELLEILATPRDRKTPAQIRLILAEMKRCGSIEHGWSIARTHAELAARLFADLDFLAERAPLRPDESWTCEVADARFLRELVNYVIYRNL
ncbi:MAG TPA: polyprenyl synthetase family protein [Burkholderiaceae bacterium]|nr:polyprenyl synthetase family protein [Burkholderiaceae bacterium]